MRRKRTDHTQMFCAAVVLAATIGIAPKALAPPRDAPKLYLGWWDVWCSVAGWMTPAVCPMPIKEPEMTPPQPTCGDGVFIGPCQQ